MRLLFMALGAVILVLGVAAGGLYLFLALIFWEPDNTRPGSLAYLLAIPAPAKDFPLWQPCGPASYSYRFQDGLSPATYWISYQTQHSIKALRSAFGQHARDLGCKIVAQETAGNQRPDTAAIVSCRVPERELRLAISGKVSSANGCRNVQVLFIEAL